MFVELKLTCHSSRYLTFTFKLLPQLNTQLARYYTPTFILPLLSCVILVLKFLLVLVFISSFYLLFLFLYYVSILGQLFTFLEVFISIIFLFLHNISF